MYFDCCIAIYNYVLIHRIPSGGYDHDFVDTIAIKYHCNICMKVLRDPRLTECCGQHYCDSCLKKWLVRNKTCPQCRKKDFQNILDKAMIREIKEFKVRCTNKTKGCKWVGELGSLEYHLESDNGCGYVMVTCSNHASIYARLILFFLAPSICGEGMERRHLTHHQKNECLYRQYTCQHCGYIDTYDAIAGSGKIRNEGSMIGGGGNHYCECVEYPLDCPNECGTENIKRKDMEEHKEICPFEAIVCPFSEICNKDNIIPRKDIEDHKKECDFRPCQCEHCGHNATYLSMSGKGQFGTLLGPNHYDKCDDYPLQCPNKCGAENIKRKDMKIHREICPLELLDCPFQQVSCSVGKILRKDMDSHCQKMTQPHLLLVVQSNKELAQKNEEIAHRNEELGRKHGELSRKVDQLTKKVEAMKKK